MRPVWPKTRLKAAVLSILLTKLDIISFVVLGYDELKQ